ncbi:epimerase [Bordetella genomosp. 8]|uniref:Epimerase n=1 Tax=Bordetella genomosp. 8 TaxID=1416806 RepID=A0A1W6YSW4_9BORD|nr:NAD-dependent epimerase/dehydratase family protein [Bordetella genomosp. 8]ARP84078.1 epimerase [Bordetella genomosp. 8]
MPALDDYIAALRGPILVTGASGFIGANLFKRIAARRNDVYAAVRRDRNWRLADVKEDQIVAVDLNDYASVQNLVNTVRPQTVLDCAAYGAYSFEEDQTLIYQTNFLSAVNFIEALAKSGVAAFVHAGSSSEYGTNCTAPAEDGVCEPNSPYAVSKVAIAQYMQYMGRYRSFPCVNLRLYSVYGPLEDTSRLLPNIVRQGLQGKYPALVNPDTSRDFVYIDDVCAAFIMAAVRMHPGLYGENINIGAGKKFTIADLAALAKQVFAIPGEPVFSTMQARKWDLADWYSDPSKAWEQLGWKATTGMEEGLRATAAWISLLSDDDIAQATKQHAQGRRRSISAIVACYKDGQAIPYMYRRLTETFRSLGVDYEIILVNDGSPDNSAEVIREISLSDPKVIGITHSRNFGSQMAFRSGMELATKEAVVLLDGDLQDPPELIAKFHEKWLEGYDVVYGRRVKREMPWYWGAMYKLFYRLFAMFSYVNIPLDAGDFSLIDRRVVGWLLNCPERDLFVRGLRAYVGFKQTGVDYVRPERMFGRTTNSLLKNIEWAKRGIFSFSNTPLTMLTSVGVVALGFSILAAVVVALLRIFFPDIAPRGVTTLLITILVFGSFNLFAIGLVGEYVAKIMLEVKGRPRLIRASLIRNGVATELLPK